MVNCNPETVSTDYDTSDKLYFEPLTVEDVLSIYEKEKPEGVIVQFGGQTPLNIAGELAAAGVKILGTSPDTIDLAEDRDRFRKIMRELGIPQPESGMASTLEEARDIADKIGYPLMVRPSYVLGGRGMEVVQDEDDAPASTWTRPWSCPRSGPILIDKFLDNAIEAEADAIADGTRCLRAGRHGAHRTGRHPFRRFGLRDPAHQHPAQAHRNHQRIHPQDRRGTERGRADEHPVRHLRKHGLCSGGQPAGIADRAHRVQGLQHLHGPPGHPGDAGQATCRPGPEQRRHPPLTASRKRSSRSTCSRRSIPFWGRKCAPPAKCWACRTPSAGRFSRPRRPPR